MAHPAPPTPSFLQAYPSPPLSNAERQAEWRKRHPDRVRAYNARRRAATRAGHACVAEKCAAMAASRAAAKSAAQPLALPARAPLALPAPPVRLALPAPAELPQIILPAARPEPVLVEAIAREERQARRAA